MVLECNLWIETIIQSIHLLENCSMHEEREWEDVRRETLATLEILLQIFENNINTFFRETTLSVCLLCIYFSWLWRHLLFRNEMEYDHIDAEQKHYITEAQWNIFTAEEIIYIYFSEYNNMYKTHFSLCFRFFS